MNKIRILIADDHTLFREGLGALLAAMPDVDVVGEASSAHEAVALALAQQPDVVLMDVQMPADSRLNGIDATRQIVQASPRIGVIMLTMLEDDDSVFAAMRAGARGYILKGADKREVFKTIRAVAEGEALFGPAIARRLMDLLTPLPAQGHAQTQLTFPELTEREREILELIAQGLNNSVIAERLVISPKTVGNHISNVFSKLQVADRAEAIVRARDAGFGRSF